MRAMKGMAKGLRTNVDNHVKNGQAFLALDSAQFLEISEVPAVPGPLIENNKIRLHSLDADGHVDHIVSQAIYFLESSEEFAEDFASGGFTMSGDFGTSGYAATFYPAG